MKKIIAILLSIILLISLASCVKEEPKPAYIDYSKPYDSIEEIFGEQYDKMIIDGIHEMNGLIVVNYKFAGENDNITTELIKKDEKMYFIKNYGSGLTQIPIVQEDVPLSISYVDIEEVRFVCVMFYDLPHLNIVDNYGSKTYEISRNDCKSNSTYIVLDFIPEEYKIYIDGIEYTLP